MGDETLLLHEQAYWEGYDFPLSECPFFTTECVEQWIKGKEDALYEMRNQ